MNPSANKMKPQVAHRRIEIFQERFGQAHFYFACHAAFSLALTPDLLYRLWANFQWDVHGEALNVPWIAVSDLLLSNLCYEVGNELYEIDIELRNILLEELETNKQFGKKRIYEISDFLLAYVQQKSGICDIHIQDFNQMQKWTALAYTRPDMAVYELALAFSRLESQDRTEYIRLASVVDTFSQPLEEFQPILIYAQGIAQWARSREEEAKQNFSKLPVKDGRIEISGIELNVPLELIEKRALRERFQKLPKQPIKHQEEEWECVHILKHTDTVNSVALSPDNQTIVSGSNDRTIKVWDLQSGKLIHSLSSHSSSVYSVGISKDSQTIVSGNQDGAVRVWSLLTGKEIRNLSGHRSAVFSVSISSDSKTVISGGEDKIVRIWDLETSELVHSLSGHSNWIRAVAINPDSKYVVSGGDDMEIKVWDCSSGTLIRNLRGHSRWIRTLAFNTTNGTLVSSGDDAKIKIWNISSGELLRTVSEFVLDRMYCVSVSPDGRFIIGCGRDKRIKIWSLDTWKLPQSISGHSNQINSVVCSSSGSFIVSGSSDNTLRVWKSLKKM